MSVTVSGAIPLAARKVDEKLKALLMPESCCTKAAAPQMTAALRWVGSHTVSTTPAVLGPPPRPPPPPLLYSPGLKDASSCTTAGSS